MRPWVTWRRVALGGAVTMSVFVLFVGAFMVLRAVGIGPSASLLAAGVLTSKDKVLVTDFRAPGGDSTIGIVVADALRTDLEQSRVVTVMEPAAVRDALERMQRPPGSRIDLSLARAIAAREGIKAVVDRDIAALGTGFIASVRLVSAQTGDVLAAYRESAKDANGLIPAVDQLSRQLRAKIGESLRLVNAAPRLERVSTASLEALRKYTQGARAAELERDDAAAIGLLRDAIALDTNFAMAYRKLGIVYANQYSQPTLASAMVRRAFELRDHLPELERHLTAGSYLSTGAVYDRSAAIGEYEGALAIDPDNVTALNNVALLYADARDHRRARDSYSRSVAVDSNWAAGYTNVANEQFALGDTAGAFQSLRALERRAPTNPDIYSLEVLHLHGDRAVRFSGRAGSHPGRQVSQYAGGATLDRLGFGVLGRGSGAPGRWKSRLSCRGTRGPRAGQSPRAVRLRARRSFVRHLVSESPE